MSEPASAINRTTRAEALAFTGTIRTTYLCTTFPKLTEVFVQREIRALRRLPVELEVHSLWGGEPYFEGLSIYRFVKWKVVALLWLLPYWLFRKPTVFLNLFKELVQRRPPSWKNLGETLIGIAFALTHAESLSRRDGRPDVIHAAWATMPATAARLIHQLTGTPFTMSAHAYDVFQDGGDWLLPGKMRDAARVITSTESTRAELVRRGANQDKIAVVLSGLFPIPKVGSPRLRRHPLRILSVNRLVEKKGLFEQLAIYEEMKRQNITFEARIVGGGPLANKLQTRLVGLNLSQSVVLTGSLPFSRVLDELARTDVLVFTGKIASDGDRDGLPNVIVEAMATGTPVVSTTIAGVPELVEDDRNGILLPDLTPEKWIRALMRLRDDDVLYRRLCREGRASVERSFDACVTTQLLLKEFYSVR